MSAFIRDQCGQNSKSTSEKTKKNRAEPKLVLCSKTKQNNSTHMLKCINVLFFTNPALPPVHFCTYKIGDVDAWSHRLLAGIKCTSSSNYIYFRPKDNMNPSLDEQFKERVLYPFFSTIFLYFTYH